MSATRIASAAGGASLAYHSRGSGPCVLCIQGVGVVGNGWRPQVEALADRYSMTTFDNRGIGGSTRGEGPLTIEAMAADATAVADAAGLTRFHLLGHSMGGLIALQVALTVPSRVSSLALLCTFGDGAVATRLSWRLLWLGARSRVGTRAMRRRGMLRLILPDDGGRDADVERMGAELAALFGHDLADQPSIAMAQLRATSRCNTLPRLGALGHVPTLVCSAAHDPIAPPWAGRAIAAGIAGARYVEFADAGHALPVQHAGRVNALLAEHFAAAGAHA